MSLVVNAFALAVVISNAGNLWSFARNVIYKLFPFSYTDRLKHVEWVMVTGATDGVGLEMARELAKAGKGVVVVGRNPRKLAKVKQWFDDNKYSNYRIVRMDLSDIDFLHAYEAKWKDQLKDLPKIDMIVNNAGVIEFNDMTAVDYHNAEVLLSTNTLSAIVVTNEYLKSLKGHSRSACNVVFISSGSVFLKYGYLGHYAYSKHIGSSYFRYIHRKISKAEAQIQTTILHLGSVVTKLNVICKDLYTSSGSQVKEVKLFGTVTAKEAARSILWQSVGELESHGPVIHYIYHASVSDVLVHEVGKLFSAKVINHLKAKQHCNP